MKAQVSFVLALVMGAMMLSCSHEEAGYASGNLPDQVKVTLDYGGVKSLTYFEFDDYDFTEMVEYRMGRPLEPVPACSEIRRGNFVARNLDWFQYDQATYVVAVPHTEKHQASLAVCGTSDLVKHEFDNLSITGAEANHLLAYTNDGMNESGVYIGVNVVPFGQMVTDDSGEGRIDYHPESGVNSTKAQLYTSFVTRLVLDHATDLQSAQALIEGTPWLDSPSMVAAGFQLHWLVCTAEGSFVCEFIDGKPQFIYAASVDTPDYGNIMTNFSNYLMANYNKVQSHGSGYDRFNVLKANYEATAAEHAQMVYFSKMYSDDYNDPDYFWTDSASDQFPAAQLMEWRDNPDSRTGELWDSFVDAYDHSHEIYDWTTLGYDYERVRGMWFTAHSSVWDLQNKALVLDIEEQNQFKAVFSL